MDMPPRFLVSLLREMVIFFSLIGGKPAKLVVMGIVQEFGNPDSAFYRNAKTKGAIGHGLKLLQVAARGLKRYNDPLSLDLLEMIAGREQEFIALNNNPAYHATVEKIMDRLPLQRG